MLFSGHLVSGVRLPESSLLDVAVAHRASLPSLWSPCSRALTERGAGGRAGEGPPASRTLGCVGCRVRLCLHAHVFCPGLAS